MTRSESIEAFSTLPPDVWAGLLQYPGIYLSSSGRVLSLRGGKPRLLKGTRRGKYLALSCVAKGPYLHRVMCETFHGPRSTPRSEVRHLDGNLNNNDAINLAWGTRAENRADMVAHGTSVHGERNPMARLSRAAVSAMRAEFDASGGRYRDIAVRYGVSTMTAYRAIRGQSWK